MMRRIRITRGYSNAAAKPNVTIQPAIQRKPTDLLKALSETVGVDTTAPHFAFIDDPITIPSTQNAKKTYFMAKELGKRAARQLAEEWPTLFAFDRDQPRLPVFRPEKLADPLQIEPTEKNLLEIIKSRQVQDACTLYERMRSENIDVSDSTQLELFRLVAYYNSRNAPFAEWHEWHGMRNFAEDETHSWQSASVADLLFETLPKTDETVSIMIAALCKFANSESVERARQLYKENSTLKIRREAYNLLISTSNFKIASNLCAEMSKNGMKPDVSTFDSLLIAANKIEKFEDRVDAFTKILSEMSHLKIRPALSTYHKILKGLDDKSKNKEKEMRHLTLAISWVSQILDELSQTGEPLEPSSSSCNLFFYEAMGVAYRCANIEIAEKLRHLYEHPNNRVKMPAFTIESNFYNRYLQLYIEQTASIEQIYTKYIELVPRLVGASESLCNAVYQKLARQPHWALLRRVIEDGINAGQIAGKLGGEMRKQLINVQYHTLSVAERDEFTQIVQKMVATLVEFSQFTDEYTKRMQRKLSPSQISDLALLLTRIGEIPKAYELLDLLLDENASEGDEATVFAKGYPRPSSMAELFEDALRRRDAYGASTCLEIMALNGNRRSLEPLANRIFERCSLTDTQKKIIEGFVRLRPE
ncbi:unnamed protein product [Caenorhabditis bovis]|uniref:Small ribosomal subunit protein mS39 n=1 Tax=Caenorhabditis bovis TaxID=2654633 RepID=A0A8S1F3P7_9PELO|nr:unnamed protein product [Caenorhabditis bovis]